MIDALRKRLVRLYTIVTGCILTGIVIVLALISFQSSNQKADQLFSSQFVAIYQKLQYDNTISHTWLNEIESQNSCLISIEENGSPLLYSGAYSTRTPRTDLIEQAKEQARSEQIETSFPPVSTSYKQTSLFTFRGSNGDSYRGSVAVFLSQDSFYSLILLWDTSSLQKTMLLQSLAYLCAAMLGILILYFANKKLVTHSLVPIRENEEKQKAFLAAASHELRSPLSVIRASADAARIDPSKSDTFLPTILRECDRMSRLIKDMLLLTVSQNKDWSLHPAQIDTDTLLLNIYEAYLPICKSKHISLKILLPEDPLPWIYGDSQRITQIITILLDNALAHANTCSIELKGTFRKKQLFISVIDHGSGIPDLEKEHIFESFYRSDHSRNQKQHFGLGLSVALELAARHKGRICVTDTAGGGSTITVILPLA